MSIAILKGDRIDRKKKREKKKEKETYSCSRRKRTEPMISSKLSICTTIQIQISIKHRISNSKRPSRWNHGIDYNSARPVIESVRYVGIRDEIGIVDLEISAILKKLNRRRIIWRAGLPAGLADCDGETGWRCGLGLPNASQHEDTG